MFEQEYYRAVQADIQRKVAWADTHAWKYEGLRRQQARTRGATAARLLRALAVRFAPVEAESVSEHGQLAVD